MHHHKEIALQKIVATNPSSNIAKNRILNQAIQTAMAGGLSSSECLLQLLRTKTPCDCYFYLFTVLYMLSPLCAAFQETCLVYQAGGATALFPDSPSMLLVQIPKGNVSI